MFDHRYLLKILGGRGRRYLPLQGRTAPGVCRGLFSFKYGPDKIAEHKDQSGGKNPGAYRRYHMIGKILRLILEISSRHPLEAQNEHREIKDIEPDKRDEPGDLCGPLVVHPPNIFGNQ